MKLKHKKMIMLVAAGTLALCVIIMMILPSPSATVDPEEAQVSQNKYVEINKLVKDYFKAKLTVDLNALKSIVTDTNQVSTAKWTAQKEYVENYNNINCYVIANEDESRFRVYAFYDMKIRNIPTSAPSLSALYVTLTSDDQYRIYFSALDPEEEKFILSADQNYEVVKLKKDTDTKLKTALAKDVKLKAFYSKLGQQATKPAATVAPTKPVTPVKPAVTPARPAVTPLKPAVTPATPTKPVTPVKPVAPVATTKPVTPVK